MKILFVTDYFFPHIGGVEKLFESLTSSLAEKGNHIVYLTWRYDKKLPAKEIYKGVEVIRVNAPSRLFFPFYALIKIIKQARDADLIHTSTYSSAIGVWIASIFIRSKTIVTVHEVWGKLWKDLPFLSKAEKLLFRLLEQSMLWLKFSKYVAVSNSTQKMLQANGVDEKRIVRIYNGIPYDLPQWSVPEMPFTFTFFGRAGVSKGLDLLVEAAKIIQLENQNIQFKFILSPQDKRVFRWVENEINGSSLKQFTTIYSNLPNDILLSELLMSHCVIIPSYCEGFGFSAAEASAMGIPVISSGRGSLPEVVSGAVIEMNELSVEALVIAMNRAICGDFDQVPLKIFNVSDFVEQHLALYHEVLAV